jgi:hypothetical protein
MAQLLRAYSLEVQRGWQQQYDQQATVLVWPASFDDQFREKVEKLRPIEIVPPPPTPITMDLPIRERQLYRDFINLELPTLAKTIGTEWRASAAAVGGGSYGAGDEYGPSSGLGGGLGAGAYTGDPTASSGYPGSSASGYPGSGYSGSGVPGAPGAAAVVDKSIVIWSPANQQELLSKHFGFISSEEPPSTLEVLYAQEDLWVLQNIMDMIKAANRDADGKDAVARHEATVKMIDFVRIGRSAMGLAGRISPVGAAATGMGGYGSASMGPGMGASMGPGMSAGASPDMAASGASVPSTGAMSGPAAGGSAGMMGPMGAQVSTDPAFGRYVNEKYEPLDPKRLREAWTSTNPADALLAVAKRMPVRMRFAIDQRRLNKLLAECGNSRLPVEVRQVRLNREAAPAGGMGGYGSGGYGEYSGGSDVGGSGAGDGMGGGLGGPGGLSGLGMGGLGGLGASGGMSGPGGYGGSGYGSDSASYADSYGSSGAMPGMGGMGRPGTPRPVGGASHTSDVDPNLVVVELYGIVYIYNPVNKSQLGLEEATTTVSTPPPAEPAPVTPPATPVSAPAPTEAPATTAVPPPAAIVPGVSGGN